MKRTESAGGVVVNGVRVAVVMQRGNVWSLPKGHVEEGETPMEAARREILEECGISELVFRRDLGVYERHRIGKEPGTEDTTELKSIRMYLFSTEEEDLRPTDRKILEARWFRKAEVADILTHPRDREFFRNLKL